MPHDLTASILFVDEHGSLLEKARLLKILLNEKAAKPVYEKLLSLQNPDGGFPSRPRAGSASSVDSTLTALWQLDELGMFETPEARRGLDFLVAQQRAYGGWDENPNLPAHDLPPWIRPGETATRLYLSAYAAYWIGLGGKDYQPVLQKAAAFLAAWQGAPAGLPKDLPGRGLTGRLREGPTIPRTAENLPGHPSGVPGAPSGVPGNPSGTPGKPPGAPQRRSATLASSEQPIPVGSLSSGAAGSAPAASPGQIPGYLHNNWLGASAFLLAGSGYAQNARLAIDFLLSRPFGEWEDSQIAWAIDCLVRAGLPANHPLVQGGIATLQMRRASDGSWASEDGPAFAASATVGVIKVLTRLGV